MVANESHQEPVIVRCGLVVQNMHRAVICGDHRVESAVVVQIANRHPARDPQYAENTPRLLRDIHKAMAGIACKQQRLTIM
jgi:hypothetical protein